MKNKNTFLDILGTITLDENFMNRTIDFGEIVVDHGTNIADIVLDLNPNKFNYEIWLEFVPKVFRKKA